MLQWVQTQSNRYFGRVVVTVILCLLAFSATAEVQPKPTLTATDRQELWTGVFDAYFKKYTKQYFGPFYDWQWFKAQAIAESRLTVDAESWVGAQGIMQIMPATYGDIQERNPHFDTVDKPRWNIAAGIFYNQYLYTKLHKVPEPDRMLLMFAAYNAGLGSVYRAQRKANGSTVWEDIKPYMPRETQGYVERIKLVREHWVLHPGGIPEEIQAAAEQKRLAAENYQAELPEVAIDQPTPSRARAVVSAAAQPNPVTTPVALPVTEVAEADTVLGSPAETTQATVAPASQRERSRNRTRENQLGAVNAF